MACRILIRNLSRPGLLAVEALSICLRRHSLLPSITRISGICSLLGIQPPLIRLNLRLTYVVHLKQRRNQLPLIPPSRNRGAHQEELTTLTPIWWTANIRLEHFSAKMPLAASTHLIIFWKIRSPQSIAGRCSSLLSVALASRSLHQGSHRGLCLYKIRNTCAHA